MAITDRYGLPVAVWVGSASPHEVTLVEPTVEQLAVSEKPERLIGDKAYDSDPLDAKLKEDHGIELIAPHKANRVSKKTQDGRTLRRMKRRWKVERLFAWLHNFRRVVIRWEYHPQNYAGMVELACAVIVLRYL